MGRIRTAVTVGGALAGLALVAALYLQPGLVFELSPAVAAVVAELDPSLTLLLAAAVLLGLGVLKLLAGRLLPGPTTGGRAPTADGRPRSRAETRSLYAGGAGEVEAFGAGVDERFAAAVDYEGRDGEARRRAREEVVEELRAAAVTAYAQSTGREREHAEAAVAAGEWTDDRRAAGLLSGEEGPSVPVYLWALDLLLGRDPFVEGVERSIEAVAALNGDLSAARRRTGPLHAGVTDR